MTIGLSSLLDCLILKTVSGRNDFITPAFELVLARQSLEQAFKVIMVLGEAGYNRLEVHA